MAHFAVICPEEGGHLLSVGALGSELVRRGHRVSLVARDEAAGLAQQMNLELCALQTDELTVPFPHLQWAAFSLVGAGVLANLRHWFRCQSELALRFYPSALRELAVDGVVIDHTVTAGPTVAEHLGLPFVTICSALLWHEESDVPPPYTPWRFTTDHRAEWRNRAGYAAWRWFMGPTLKSINRYRSAWNLPRWHGIADGYSPLAQVSQLCVEFDFPRRELPDHFHYVGSLACDRPTQHDDQFPWDRLDERPLILASLGTVPVGPNRAVFRKIVQACQGLPAQLVLALGRWGHRREESKSLREEIAALPGDHIAVDFAPQLALLDRAALLITHAGVNSVLEALVRGVPMVVLPRGDDQPGMGARVVRSGVGLRASFSRSTPEEVRGLVQRVLADETFRRRARELQRPLLAAGGVRRAAEIAEQALMTGRPVCRG
jgi:zeaxanthin glucosyltransferase